MTVYFMGNEIAGLVPSDSNGYETASGGYDVAFNRCSVRYLDAGSYIRTPVLSLPDNFWVHFRLERPVLSEQDQTLMTLNDGTDDVLRLQGNSDGTIDLDVWISSAWNTVASATIPLIYSSPQTFDLYVEGNSATGTAQGYTAGTIRLNPVATVDMTNVAGIQEVRWYGALSTYLSEVVIAGASTIGGRLATRYPSANGSSSAWAGGGAAAVDELVYSDGDYIASATATQVSTFTLTGPTTTGYIPTAVAVYGRAKKGASGPTQLQMALRIGGTNYFSPSQSLTTGYEGVGYIWETDPSTSGDWSSATVDALEAGVKSIA